MTRHAGVLLPLTSTISSRSWGIGDAGSVAPFAAWLGRAGFDRWMILPIGTMAAGGTSPYSAASAMAIDPIFLPLERLEDFTRAGGVDALSTAAREALVTARASGRLDYEQARIAKADGQRLAFDAFMHDEWAHFTPRAGRLAGYIARERWWLDDYALFMALNAVFASAPWTTWPEGVRRRDPHALDEARRQLAREVLRQQYLQWVTESAWQDARASARAAGVSMFGDLPFAVDLHSADVWARQDEFLIDVSVGTPPDAFSATGQDWSLPAPRWDAMARSDFAWIRNRVRRMAALFDGLRVDHLVGFYRTFGRPATGDPFFSPVDEDTQTWQGESIVRIFQESGAAIVAEDLGTVPDFVRASLARMGVAGYRVLRWERDWHTPGQPFLDPASYPPASVATTGTHDTETLADWWDHAPVEERQAVLAMPGLRDVGIAPGDVWTDRLRDALLAVMVHSGSNELFLPVPDLFGWRDRINTPATVGDTNWTWCLPWFVDRMDDEPAARERAAFLAQLAGTSRRGRT